MPDYTKKVAKFGNEVFKDKYFFDFLAINVFRICSKCLVDK